MGHARSPPRRCAGPTTPSELAAAPRPRPARTRRWSPARARCAAAGSPSWPASSGSWPGRSGWRPPSGCRRGRAGHRRAAAAAGRARLRAAPGCRRARVAFVQMVEDHRGGRRRTGRRACRTWSTCGTRRPAGCSRRGARWGTSRSPSRGRSIGFLGPRVYEALYGEPFPEGVQMAENLRRARADRRGGPGRGDRARSRPGAARAGRRRPARGARRRPASRPEAGPAAGRSAWEAITARAATTGPACGSCSSRPPPTCPRSAAPARARRTPGCCWRWPGSAARRASCSARTGAGQRPSAPLGPGGAAGGPARDAAGRRAAAAAGHRDRHGGRGAVEGGRGGRAGRGDRPLPGRPGHARRADGVPAARGGRGRRRRWRCCRPTGCCARQHGWLSPLPPEGASAILYRSVDFAPEIAQSQGVRATDLRRDGIVDRVIPELPDAAYEPGAFCRGWAGRWSTRSPGCSGATTRQRCRTRRRHLGHLGR